MSQFKRGLFVLITLMVTTVIVTAFAQQQDTEANTPGRTFTLKSVDSRYGYLRYYGYYKADKLYLLEFSTVRRAGSFRFLSSGAIQEVSSGLCFTTISDTNLQLVLKGCSGNDIARWRYRYSSKSGKGHLVNSQTGKCLSPWNYLNRPPATVKWVPGLDDCQDYNTLILNNTEANTPGRTFTLKSVDSRYGYLRYYGYYKADKLYLLEFSTVRRAGSFRFLSSGAIQEVSSGLCFTTISDTNLQLVLKGCSGNDIARWRYRYSSKSGKGHLVNSQTGKCLSPWSYLNRPPATVKWVPGLDDCQDYNTLILNNNRGFIYV